METQTWQDANYSVVYYAPNSEVSTLTFTELASDSIWAVMKSHHLIAVELLQTGQSPSAVINSLKVISKVVICPT